MQLHANRAAAQNRVAPFVPRALLAPYDNTACSVIILASQLLQEKLFRQILLGEAGQEGAVPGDLPEARRLD
jgi:hypothetical protein